METQMSLSKISENLASSRFSRSVLERTMSTHHRNLQKVITSHQACQKLTSQHEKTKKNYQQVVLKHIEQKIKKARLLSAKKGQEAKAKNNLKLKKHLQLMDVVNRAKNNMEISSISTQISRPKLALLKKARSPSDITTINAQNHNFSEILATTSAAQLRRSQLILSQSRQKIRHNQERKIALNEIRASKPRVSDKVTSVQKNHEKIVNLSFQRYLSASIRKQVRSDLAKQNIDRKIFDEIKNKRGFLEKSIQIAADKRRIILQKILSGTEKVANQQIYCSAKNQQNRSRIIEQKIKNLRKVREYKEDTAGFIIQQKKRELQVLAQKQMHKRLAFDQQRSKGNKLLQKVLCKNLYESQQLSAKLR